MDKIKSKKISDLTANDVLVSPFNEFKIIDLEVLPTHISVVVRESESKSTYSWRFMFHERVYVKVQ